MIRKVCLGIIIFASIVGAIKLVYEKFSIPDDNPIEELVEQVIKEQTGLDIDLTPDSPDENIH